MEDTITDRTIGAAIEVHKIRALDCSKKFEEALCRELELQHVSYARQIAINVMYKNSIIKGQRLDLLVENKIIVEVKSLRTLPEISTAQVLSYLKSTGLKRGLILNFGRYRLDGI